MKLDIPSMLALVAEGEAAVASARGRLQDAKEALEAIRAKSSPVTPSVEEWEARVNEGVAVCELEVAESLAEAQLDAARMIVAIRKTALDVVRVANEATPNPTVAHLRHAVRIYEDYMSDTTATLVESIARGLAVNDERWIKPTATILDCMKHLRSSHGSGFTSWDTVSDIKDVIQEMEPEEVA